MYGVVIADEGEFSPVSDYARTKRDFVEGMDRGNRFVQFTVQRGAVIKAVLCGVGKVNAASAASFLIADGAEAIINIGLSGSLDGTRGGSFVIGSSLVEVDFDLTNLGYREFEKPGQEYVYRSDADLCAAATRALPSAVRGVLGCGDFFLSDSVKAGHLRDYGGIVAFDMESGAIASVCYKCGVPFISIRQISDGASEDAIGEYRERNSREAPDLLNALLNCVKYYREVKS